MTDFWSVVAAASICGVSPCMRTSRPRWAPACSSAIVIRVSISRSRTISLETACEALITAPTSNCSAGAPIAAVGEASARMLAEVRMELLELPDLSLGAPAKIAVARVPQIGVSYTLNAARRVEPRGHFMGRAPRSERSRVRERIEWPARTVAWRRRPGLRCVRSRPTPERACRRKSVDDFRPTRAVVPGAPSGARATLCCSSADAFS